MNLLQPKIFVDKAFVMKSDQIIPATMSKNVFRVTKGTIFNPHEIASQQLFRLQGQQSIRFSQKFILQAASFKPNLVSNFF